MGGQSVCEGPRSTAESITILFIVYIIYYLCVCESLPMFLQQLRRRSQPGGPAGRRAAAHARFFAGDLANRAHSERRRRRRGSTPGFFFPLLPSRSLSLGPRRNRRELRKRGPEKRFFC